MLPPKEVTDLKVSDSTRFNRDGSATPIKVLTYFVGTQGPFRIEYAAGEFSADKVNRDLEKQVRELREIGALPGAMS